MDAYRVKYLDWKLPAQTGLGEETTFQIRMQNKSHGHWYATGENGNVPVVASYHWIDDRGRYTAFEGLRTPLPKDVPPGTAVDIDLRVRLPERQGRYILEVSLLQDGVAWFHDKGVEPLRLQISLAADGTYTARRLPTRWIGNLRSVLTSPFTTLYRERNLIWNMARQDLLGRYKGTVGGGLWAVLNPLLLISVYIFLFAFILRVRFSAQGGITDFAFYFIGGWIPWMAFSDSVVRSPGVIADNSNLVKKVVFPLEILPVNQVLSAFLTSLIGLGLYLVALVLFGMRLHTTLFLLPLVMAFQIGFTLGLSWFLASLGVFLRDVGQVVGIGITMWFFLTPIVYPETVVGPTIQQFYKSNPFFHFVRAYRGLILDGAVPGLLSFAAMALSGTIPFYLGYAWFRRTQKSFADVL